jgi:Tol biopolymer transport system component
MKRHWPNGAFWRTVLVGLRIRVAMSVLPSRHAEDAARSSPEARLDSWKEIASYLGRGVRTVQRWERDEGLPVHRLAHEKRGSVYAYRPEVDAWWESRRVTLSAEPPETAESPSRPGVERITWMSAATFWPALSSDSRLLAYISDGGRDGASPQIWLQQIGGSPVCLTTGECERSHLCFAPGDTELVFSGRDATGQHVFTMPTLGGAPRILKRAATAGRPSPDGRWLAYLDSVEANGVRIASLSNARERTIASNLTDIGFAVWSPDSRHVLMFAHADAMTERDYWVASADGSEVVNTGIFERLQRRGHWPITAPAAWLTTDSLVFSAITPEGVSLWRQRLSSATWQPTGDPERLTVGSELDSNPTVANGRVAFVSTHMDQNLWSLAIDPATGASRGPLRRLTRGPGIVMHLSVSRDAGTLAYFRARRGNNALVLRNLETDAERTFSPEPRVDYGFPALSPSSERIAFGARVPGPQAVRPIFVASTSEDIARQIGEGDRPREWVDERFLLVERFGSRLNSIALLDTTNGDRFDLLSSDTHSITNARVSPGGRWIAFDATRPGGRPSVFAAPFRVGEAVGMDAWMIVAPSASHPFWSADGGLLYYLPATPSTEFRSVVRARRVASAPELSLGDELDMLTLTEMVVPTMITGTAPVAATEHIVFVLGDYRGDVWMMELE